MEFVFSSSDIKMKSLRSRQLFWDTIGGFLGSTTLAAALSEGYYYFYEAEEIINHSTPQPKGNTYSIAMGTPQESPRLYHLRTYIMIASILLAISLIFRYLYERKIRILTLKASGLWTKKYRYSYWLMAIEVLYALVFLPPHSNGVFTDSETGVYVTTDMLITTLMTGRIYLIGRTLYSYSLFHGEAAHKACRDGHIICDLWFVFKCELKSKPFILVGILLCILFFTFGFGLRQAEIPYEFISMFDWDFIVNGVWVIFLTVLTIGYGDIYPETSLGRLFCVIAAMLGSFFTSLLVIGISNFFAMSMKERNAIFTIKRRRALKKLRLVAQEFIVWSWKYSFFVRQLRILSQSKANHIHYKMCIAYLNFKERRQKMWLESEYSISPVDRAYYNVSNSLGKFAEQTQMIMWDVRIFQQKLLLLEQRQEQIEKITDIVYIMHNQIENVTKPYIHSKGTKARVSVANISLSEIDSLLKSNNQEWIKEIQQISAQIPSYDELSKQIERAFRFRETKFKASDETQLRFQRSPVRRSTKVLWRIQKAQENKESEEAVRSGAVLKVLEPIFGKGRSRALFNELKNTDSKRFSKISAGLADALKSMGSEVQDEMTSDNSSRNATPRFEDSPLMKRARHTIVLEALSPNKNANGMVRQSGRKHTA